MNIITAGASGQVGRGTAQRPIERVPASELLFTTRPLRPLRDVLIDRRSLLQSSSAL